VDRGNKTESANIFTVLRNKIHEFCRTLTKSDIINTLQLSNSEVILYHPEHSDLPASPLLEAVKVNFEPLPDSSSTVPLPLNHIPTPVLENPRLGELVLFSMMGNIEERHSTSAAAVDLSTLDGEEDTTAWGKIGVEEEETRDS
jgi:hypothetical protein